MCKVHIKRTNNSVDHVLVTIPDHLEKVDLNRVDNIKATENHSESSGGLSAPV